MSSLKNLAKDTIIYGMSSMLGRFLNWLLVPFYMATLTSTGDFGDYTHIYAITALLLVLLTFGMETAFFRYANKNEENPQNVYSTTLIAVGSLALGFLGICILFKNSIAGLTGHSEHPDYIAIMAAVVAIDAFISIPFAYLRFQRRPVRFATIKFLFVVFNIFFNLFFLLLCPYLHKNNPESISWFYCENYQVGYIFVSNLLANIFVLILLIPDIVKARLLFFSEIFKRMFKYAIPLLSIGLIGVLNQNIDKIIFPLLIEDPFDAKSQLGIYGACFKIAVVMAMFIQAFRFAYEPIIFSENKNKDNKVLYSKAMTYFILFALLIFLTVMYFLDFLEKYIKPDYYAGIRIVPIVMMGELFFGIYFNLSLWYKLTDKTQYGAYFSTIGCIVILLINIFFVPQYGYIASAWAFFTSNLVMMLLSYFWGQKYYPINYQIKLIAFYTFLTVIFYIAGLYPHFENPIFQWGYRGILLLVYFTIVFLRERSMRSKLDF